MVKSLSAGVSCPTFFLACREGLGKHRNIPSGETGPACRVEAVIASGAKQSMPRQAVGWIASSLTLLAMTVTHPDTVSRSRGGLRPRFTSNFAPPEKRGRRECRMRAAPAVSCANCAKKRTRAYRLSGGNPTSPAQWLYGLCRDLLGDEFVLPPSPREFAAKGEPGWAPSPPQSLTPATGARTTRFCRTQQRHSSCADQSLTALAALQSLTRATPSRPPLPALHVS